MLLCALSSWACSGSADAVQLYSSIILPGASAYALVQAYKSTSLAAGSLDPPYALQDHSIEILSYPNKAVVTFFPNVVGKPAVVTVKDGQVISQTTLTPTRDAQPIVLPGVVAGELIAAYNYARQRQDDVIGQPGNTYDVWVELSPGGSTIAFVPLRSPVPADRKCIEGNCNGRSVYNVRLENGKVAVTRQAII